MSLIINFKTPLFILLFLSLALPVSASEKPNAEQIFKQKCSLCHAIDKRKLGPAVKAMGDEKGILRETIVKGKKPMPSYAGKLSDAEIDALVNYILANR